MKYFSVEIWSEKNDVSDPHATKIAGLLNLQTGRWGSFGEKSGEPEKTRKNPQFPDRETGVVSATSETWAPQAS